MKLEAVYNKLNSMEFAEIIKVYKSFRLTRILAEELEIEASLLEHLLYLEINYRNF